jgi:hypothetical protein
MTIFSLTNLTLLTALVLSSIAAWYSILGLTAIFAAATIPIIIMGGALEVAKVVTTAWLHRYWNQVKWKMKFFLTIVVLGLALLTSIGVFGFLSKAHIEQGVPTGDIAAKLALIDEKIKIQRENITVSRTALSQLDAQVNARLDRGTSEQGAERAIQIRRQQQAERNKLLKEINDAQVVITKLNEERAPIAAEYRKVEAEVGPIKYLAALIYDDGGDKEALERAVRWLILLIVFVFDPLALTLVLAANSSREWDKHKNKVVEEPQITPPPPVIEEPKMEEKEVQPAKKEDDFDISKHAYLFKPYKHFSPNKPQVPNPPIEDRFTITPTKDEIVPIPAESDTPQIVEKSLKPYTELPGGYVNYKGKHMSLEALRQMHPELFLVPDLPKKEKVSTGFPKNPQIDDIHIRTDLTPNRVYRFTGTDWEETDKSQINFDEKYIQHLIQKLEKGEMDVQLLTDNEKAQIEEYLKNRS